MAVPKKKTSKSKSRSRRAGAWKLECAGAQPLPPLRHAKLPHVVCATCGWYKRPRGRRRRLSQRRVRSSMLPIAVDAMGGDKAPARSSPALARAVDDRHPGRARRSARPERATRRPRGDRGVRGHRDGRRPGRRCAARRTRRSCGPPRRCATARRRRWSRPATPAPRWPSALLRMGRIKGVTRPADRHARSRCPARPPTVLLDAGANAECSPSGSCSSPRWASVYARHRFGIAEPRSACCRSARSPPRATRCARRRTPLLRGGAAGSDFVGNVEGRDLMTDDVDVVVTDGFTGNVALKTLEGGMKALVGALLAAFADRAEPRGRTPRCSCRRCCRSTPTLDPDTYGGAMLLGVDGVCIISHGSSGATAIVNAIGVAQEMVDARRGRPAPRRRRPA